MPKKKVITKNRKKKARSIRKGSRTNPDGTQSSHLMESGTSSGKFKYVVNPTIFPSGNGEWVEPNKTGDRNSSYREAQERGEVFGFKREKRAEKFAAGSWKKGTDRREAMKNYREGKREAERSTFKNSDHKSIKKKFNR